MKRYSVYPIWICNAILTLTVGVTVDKNRLKNECRIYGSSMNCDGVLPDFVPTEIRNLEISSVEGNAMAILGAWTHIESLSIQCSRSQNLGTVNLHRLPNNAFHNMTNLRFLKISCNYLYDISVDAFDGLVKIKVLDLSGCVRLSPDRLTPALKYKLPSLEELSLRRISLFRTDVLFFNREFFESLTEKPLHLLDLSGTKYGSMDMRGFADSLPYIKEVNVSEGGFLAMNLVKCFYDYSERLQTIRTVDVSYLTITDTFLDPSNSLYWKTKFPPVESFVQNLSTIFVEGFVPKGVRTRIYGVDLGSRVCTQLVILQHNITLTTFCLMKTEHGIPLQRLSIAFNGIEHVDESLTSAATDIRYVDLSHNRLYLMNKDHLEKSMQKSSRLTEFYVTNNYLTYVPYWLFKNTSNLEIIDLSYNNLISLGFKINHLRYLRILKLNNNNIYTIGTRERAQLHELILAVSPDNRSAHAHPGLRVEVFSNPFECSCDNKNFFEWLCGVKVVHYRKMCGIESKHRTRDHKILSELEMHCKRPIIIASSCGVAALFVTVIIVAGVIFIRKRIATRKKIHLKQLINKYKVDGDAVKYPVFLSYSSSDDEFINKHIVNEMNTRLQRLLNTDKQCVATGDATFRPGRYVIEEIIKYIELSEVVVLCISKSFCKSPWCKDEIFVSHYNRKSMVLMFLEEVKNSDMPKVLQTFFNSYTRSKWIKGNDGARLVPDWETVCQSIVDLMGTDSTTAV